MDTIEIIKDKVKVLSSLTPNRGLRAVVRHIEMAESHFTRARMEQDNDLFTDVVFRTNHAFEGILKEAYALLEGIDPESKKPYEIEQYLSQTSVFRPRVMELFKNYRTEWRNPATHDYQLSFTEQEAFLSILSVSSFVSILLDQMIEKAAYNSEKESVDKKVPEVREDIQESEMMPLVDRVAYSLIAFSKELQQSGAESTELRERQLIGMLHAFINSIHPEITVEVEPVLHDDSGWLRPDFMLARGDECIVLEVYRYKRRSAKIEERRNQQMLRYLRAANISSGIIFTYPVGPQRPQKLHAIIASEPDHEHMIVWVRPRPRD